MPPKSPQSVEIPQDQRARSVPHKRAFVVANIYSAIFFLSVVATIAMLVAVFVLRNDTTAIALGVCVGINVITWLIAFMKRRSVSCPLCKGTPYVDNGALKHIKARRIFPLGYAGSNLLTSILRQRFRCQYCGTPFDLLKKGARHGAPESRR